MIGVVYAVLTLAAIGAVCAAVLVAAARYMKVPDDETTANIRSSLPGANCGACGYAGCDGYAEALANGSEKRTNLCVPGGDGAARVIADVLGVDFSDVTEKTANVKCRGDCEAVRRNYVYDGVNSCKAVSMLYGGDSSCAFGCLGYGDCVKACPQSAVFVENGVARVEHRLCIGCGLCAEACPKGLIELVPDANRVVVKCSNREKGAVARKKCENACIGCKKCEKTCAFGAISVSDNLAKINYEKCTSCGECADACPNGCIKVGDLSGQHRYAG